MERNIISVSPATRILDVHQLFVQEEIHGAPVVGDDGIVHGVISTLDLLRVVREELEPGAANTFYRDQIVYAGADWSDIPSELQDRMQEVTVADAMTRDLVTVAPDAPIADVARLMLAHHIHRVLVVDDDGLLGVISTFDLMRVLGSHSAPS